MAQSLVNGVHIEIELIRVCSLNSFQLVMGIYGGHSSLFLRVCLLFKIVLQFIIYNWGILSIYVFVIYRYIYVF